MYYVLLLYLENILKLKYANKEPSNWPIKKNLTDIGAIPVKVSVNTLAIVTAGLANDVEDVNQYPAVINSATPMATEFASCSLIKRIVVSSPKVAIISLTSNGTSPLTLVDIWNICSSSKI